MTTIRLSAKKKGNVRNLREDLLKARPGVRTLWDASEQKRAIALALVRLRTHARLTQSELAERTGWHKSFVSRLESASDTSIPDTETILRYGKACQTVVSLVFTDPQTSKLHVIDAVTLQAPNRQKPFESFVEQDMAASALQATLDD